MAKPIAAIVSPLQVRAAVATPGQTAPQTPAFASALQAALQPGGQSSVPQTLPAADTAARRRAPSPQVLPGRVEIPTQSAAPATPTATHAPAAPLGEAAAAGGPVPQSPKGAPAAGPAGPPVATGGAANPAVPDPTITMVAAQPSVPATVGVSAAPSPSAAAPAKGCAAAASPVAGSGNHDGSPTAAAVAAPILDPGIAATLVLSNAANAFPAGSSVPAAKAFSAANAAPHSGTVPQQSSVMPLADPMAHPGIVATPTLPGAAGPSSGAPVPTGNPAAAPAAQQDAVAPPLPAGPADASPAVNAALTSGAAPQTGPVAQAIDPAAHQPIPIMPAPPVAADPLPSSDALMLTTAGALPSSPQATAAPVRGNGRAALAPSADGAPTAAKGVAVVSITQAKPITPTAPVAPATEPAAEADAATAGPAVPAADLVGADSLPATTLAAAVAADAALAAPAAVTGRGHDGASTAGNQAASVQGADVVVLPDAAQQPMAAAAASRVPSSEGAPLPSVAEQISPAMIAMVQGRNAARSVSVSITPGELGQVNITVERAADGTTSIHVAAERLATLDMLRTGQADLSHALNQAGVQQSSHSLSFSWNGAPGGGSQGWAGQGWSGQGGNGQGWHGQGWAASGGQSDDGMGALVARSYAEDRTSLDSTAAARGGIDVTA